MSSTYHDFTVDDIGFAHKMYRTRAYKTRSRYELGVADGLALALYIIDQNAKITEYEYITVVNMLEVLKKLQHKHAKLD
jgi:hypothetical protein